MSIINKSADDFEQLVKLISNPEVPYDQDGDLMKITVPTGPAIVARKTLSTAVSISRKGGTISLPNDFLCKKVRQLQENGASFIVELNVGSPEEQKIEWTRELPGL